MTRLLPISGGSAHAVVDADDWGLVSGRRWYLHTGGYAIGYGYEYGRQKNVYLHRLVAGAKAGQMVDHVNHDKLDCRKANLRIVTRAENNQNKCGARTDSGTGVRGVRLYRMTLTGPRYEAGVRVGAKRIRVRGFRNVEAASVVAAELRRTHMTHSPECTE